MAERHDVGETPLALQPLQQFRQQTEGLRPPSGAKERAFLTLGGGDAALEQFRASVAETSPPLGAKERVFARVEAKARPAAGLRPRARLALAFVCLLVASSVGAVTLPGVRSLPFRLLPSLSPPPPSTPTLARPSPQRPPMAASVLPPVAQPASPVAAAESPATQLDFAAALPESAAQVPSSGPVVAPVEPPAASAVVAPLVAGAVAAAPASGKARSASGAETRAFDDTLAQQVGEYQRALALAGRNDQAALSAWRAFVRRWPTSPLRHEADLQIVAALGRLGRRDELEAAARGFLREHPESPRSGDVRKVLRASEHLPSNEARQHACRSLPLGAPALVASSLAAGGRGPRARALHRRSLPRLVRAGGVGRRGRAGWRVGRRGRDERRRRRGRRRGLRGGFRLRVGGGRGRRPR